MGELNLEKVKKNIQIILDKSHKDSHKRIMRSKPYGARPVIEMACPICGDSGSSAQKKRGNLYLNNMFYVCFNCGDRLPYISFLERFGVGIDLDDKMVIYDHIDKYGQTTTYSNKDYDLSKMDKIMNLDDVIKVYNERMDDVYDISPIQKNSAVYQYLKYKRMISNFDNIYQGILRITDKWREPIMIILNRYDENLLGFQIRNLKDEKRKRVYKIYDFQTIYNYVNEEPINEEDALPYNKLSHFYNILNVDFYDKITIFEGYLDSVFFPNSVGTTGVETDYSFLLENDELNVRFFYDNDDVGIRKSIEKIGEGYGVFLWNKLFKDLSKGDTKKEYMFKKNIKDLNDLVKSSKKNVVEYYKLESYFSVDEFDKIYL